EADDGPGDEGSAWIAGAQAQEDRPLDLQPIRHVHVDALAPEAPREHRQLVAGRQRPAALDGGPESVRIPAEPGPERLDSQAALERLGGLEGALRPDAVLNDLEVGIVREVRQLGRRTD